MNMAFTDSKEFSVTETHGILWKNNNRIHSNSEGLGWTSLYVSNQLEHPYDDHYQAVDDHLLVMHLDGPVAVSRSLSRSHCRRLVPPGGLFLLPGGMDFGVSLEGQLNSVHVYLRKQILEEVALDFGYHYSGALELIPRLGEHDPLVERLVISLQNTLMDRDSACPVYADYLSRALGAHLLRRHSPYSTVPSPPLQGSFSKLQLQRVTDFMEANLAEQVGLSAIAAVSGLSPAHFARRFKKATGLPPHQFLINLRVERAKRLLAGTDSIATIAAVCGFTHQEHMTRIFRRSAGTTPGNYRRDLLQ